MTKLDRLDRELLEFNQYLRKNRGILENELRKAKKDQRAEDYRQIDLLLKQIEKALSGINQFRPTLRIFSQIEKNNLWII